MIKRFASLLCLALAALSSRAEVVGVMADSATGEVWPAALELRIGISRLELDMAPGDSVTVAGLVQSIYSDAEQSAEENIRFDERFPDSRLTWEDWRGAITQITTDPDDGYSGTFDAAIPPQVTNGCCFFVEEESPPVAHFISAIGENNSATFSPALQSNATCSVSAIRSAVCDAFGLHSGDTTAGYGWTNIVSSPNFGNVDTALACSAEGRTVYKTAVNAKIWLSRDGGDSWEEIAASPSWSGGHPALACSADGRTVYKTATGCKVWRSRDGGDSWEELTASQNFGSTLTALACSADGEIVFDTSYGHVWRSRDGGDSWEELVNSPTLGNNLPALACSAEGRTVYKTAVNAKIWLSRDGGDSWEEIAASPSWSGGHPALACSADGRTVYKTATNQKVWLSRDGGDSWEELAASPSSNGTGPALACSVDGRIVYKTAASTGVWKSTPLFGTSATTAYSVLIDTVPRAAERVLDFYAADMGGGRVYWSLRTGENRYSIHDTGTYPVGWYDIAWEDAGTWYIRDTNGPVATAATSAPAAVSAALEAWQRNRAVESQFQPYYGYDRFDGGMAVEWALTFIPDANAVTNAPGVSAMGVLYSAFGDTPHWDTDAFRIDIVSTNPTVSKVTWAGDVATHATIRYIPEE